MIESTKAFETMWDEITERDDPDGQGGRYQLITRLQEQEEQNFIVFREYHTFERSSY